MLNPQFGVILSQSDLSGLRRLRLRLSPALETGLQWFLRRGSREAAVVGGQWHGPRGLRVPELYTVEPSGRIDAAGRAGFDGEEWMVRQVSSAGVGEESILGEVLVTHQGNASRTMGTNACVCNQPFKTASF